LSGKIFIHKREKFTGEKKKIKILSGKTDKIWGVCENPDHSKLCYNFPEVQINP